MPRLVLPQLQTYSYAFWQIMIRRGFLFAWLFGVFFCLVVCLGFGVFFVIRMHFVKEDWVFISV